MQLCPPGQSGPRECWTRMWTKIVAGDREAPSLESRWMWRYPVGRVARHQMCCPSPCPRAISGAGPRWGLAPEGTEESQSAGEQHPGPGPLPLPIPTHLASGC